MLIFTYQILDKILIYGLNLFGKNHHRYIIFIIKHFKYLIIRIIVFIAIYLVHIFFKDLNNLN